MNSCGYMLRKGKYMKKLLSTCLLIALAMSLVFVFASCRDVNQDPDKAREALEKAGYSISVIQEKDPMVLYASTTTEEDTDEFVWLYYYDSEEDADDAYYDLQEEYAKKAKEAEELNFDMGISGKVIWVGTERALEIVAVD